MPAAYAHYRFGQEALSMLSPAVRKIAGAHPQLYNAGLHGPDPLFFHNILRSDEIYALASYYHHIPGTELFALFRSRLSQPEDPRETAYLFGFLTHYCLDSQCHPLRRANAPIPGWKPSLTGSCWSGTARNRPTPGTFWPTCGRIGRSLR